MYSLISSATSGMIFGIEALQNLRLDYAEYVKKNDDWTGTDGDPEHSLFYKWLHEGGVNFKRAV